MRRAQLAILVRISAGATLLGFAACAGSPPPTLPEPPQAEACPGWPSDVPSMDVALVLDTSRSTRDPSGADINRNGVVGDYRYSQWTDRGDSRLAAQITGVRRFVRAAEGSGSRFALVAYSGRNDFPLEDTRSFRVDRRDARLHTELTDDIDVLDESLAELLERGSVGTTSFSPAMQLALRALERPPDGNASLRRHVVFLSDSPSPSRPAPGQRWEWVDPRMQGEARRAIKAGIRFHTVGFGPAADTQGPHLLAQIAGATGGGYHAVTHPADLHCSLLQALVPVVESVPPERDFAEPGPEPPLAFENLDPEAR